MKYLLSTIIIALVLVSCANTKELTKNTDSAQKSEFKNVAKDDSLFAYIRRGACFGTCPVYEIKIYNSGYTELVGTRNLDLIGNYHTVLKMAQMHALVEKAKSIGYQNMDDVYDNEMVTDLPETKTSIVIDGKRKAIRRRVNFPREILSFEEMLDALLKSEKWVKSPDSTEEK